MQALPCDRSARTLPGETPAYPVYRLRFPILEPLSEKRQRKYPTSDIRFLWLIGASYRCDRGGHPGPHTQSSAAAPRAARPARSHREGRSG